MDNDNILPITTVRDALAQAAKFVRTARQNRGWTIKELSSRSGVPASTISRLERTGLASTEALFEILFAMNELEYLHDYLSVNLKRNELPRTLAELPVEPRRILRVRHGKSVRP